MTDLDKKLSYLLDDYPGDDPGAELDAVIGDVNLQYSARRYRMIGEAMRGDLPWAIDTGFHGEVMARIHAEAPAGDGASAESQPDADRIEGVTLASPLFAWFNRPLAGLAVAAAVAVVTVTLWQPLEQSGPADGGLADASQQKIDKLAVQPVDGGAIPASTRVQPAGMRWKADNDAPALQQKLNAYLVNHTEYSNSVQGLIPQARVAGFDARQ